MQVFACVTKYSNSQKLHVSDVNMELTVYLGAKQLHGAAYDDVTTPNSAALSSKQSHQD